MEGDIDAEMMFSEGREVEVTSYEEGFRGAWFNATILKYPKKKTTKGKALIQYKDLLEEDGGKPLNEHVKLSFIRPLPPRPEVPEDQCFQVNDVVDAFHLDGWWTGFVSKISDNPKMYFVSFPFPPEEIEFPSTKFRPHWNWVDGKWVKPSAMEDALVSSDCEEPMELSCSTTNDSEAITQLESLDSECRSKKKHELCGLSSIKNETALSTASKRTTEGKFVEAEATMQLEISDSECRSKKKHVLCSISSTKNETAQSTASKRTPDATLLHPSKKLKDGSLSESLELQESKMKTEDGAKTEINKGEQPRLALEIDQPKLVLQISQSPSTGQNHASGVVEETLSEEYTVTEVGSPEMDQAIVVSPMDCQTKEIEVIGEAGGTPHENREQSPLVCCKELQSSLRKIPSVVMEENNSGHIPCGVANQRNDTRENSLQIMVHPELQKGEKLPFVESLPIWKAIDTMEIFQVMPQNPHFQPLLEFNEILREGLAVGHMMTFASSVQRASMLTISDPRKDFTSILKALVDLEMLGFDVKAVKGRTSELLIMRDKYGQLQDQSKENEVQVTQLSHELTKISEEIDAIKKKVTELEEKQALLMSKKESNTSKIATLQVCTDVATQDIQTVEYDFESLACSPW